MLLSYRNWSLYKRDAVFLRTLCDFPIAFSDMFKTYEKKLNIYKGRRLVRYLPTYLNYEVHTNMRSKYNLYSLSYFFQIVTRISGA